MNQLLKKIIKTNRYILVIAFALAIVACSKSDNFEEPVIEAQLSVGVIRWDAWYGGPVTTEEEKMLGPSHFQERAPFFTQILTDSTISINGNSQEIMTQEIDFAVQSGIDYWAFLTYPWFTDAHGGQDTELSNAAMLYLNNINREKINFCWIVGSHLYWYSGRWEKMVERAKETCLMPNYQTVLNGRPLIYFYNTGIVSSNANITLCRDRLEKLSRDLVAAGGKDPYYVFMGWNIDNWEKAKQAGFDAWSFYAGGGVGKYADAARQVKQSRWVKPTALGIPTVPVVSSGWNYLPRIEYREKYGPQDWWTDDQYTSEQRNQLCDLPTAKELAMHLTEAINFTKSNGRCEAKTCIMYAWNEHSEGGWLCPTITKTGGIDNSRVVAVGIVLNK